MDFFSDFFERTTPRSKRSLEEDKTTNVGSLIRFDLCTVTSVALQWMAVGSTWPQLTLYGPLSRGRGLVGSL